MNKLKSIILDFFKGIAIGIANVIPGFSGGTMAVILKIYERVINAFSLIAKHPIKAIKDIWSILLGLAAGIIIAIVSIVKLLEVFPLPTMLFFVGLILGSIPDIYKEYNNNGKINYWNILFFVISIALLVALPFFTTSTRNITEISIGLLVVLFLLGTLVAAAMVIPGVSGSMILMIFGYYLCVTSGISNFFECIINWDLNGLLFNFQILLAFGLGCLVGLLLISKLISFLFKRFPKSTYVVILGLLVASPFSMLYSAYKDIPTLFEPNIVIYIVSVLTLALGLIATLFLSKIGNNKNEEV